MALSYSTVLYNFGTSWSAPIVMAYLAMIFFCKPIMQVVPAMKLRVPLMVHNLICSISNLYAVVVFAAGLAEVRDVFSKNNVEGLIRHGMMVYWLSKVYELLDTVFMILRHRGRQISFLHVFHHSSITLLADWSYFINPVPAVVPIVGLNSAVHVVMYGYYFLTALRPLHDFSWKKRITQMQILQFVLVICHISVGWLYHGFCGYSLLYAFSMLILFSNFYYKAFFMKKQTKVHSTVHSSGNEAAEKLD